VAPHSPRRRIEEQLLRLLRDDRPAPHRLLARLNELGREEGVPALSRALRLLVHVEVGEEEAARLWSDILSHRTVLARALGRDPGLRVAALDYLHNVEHRLRSPKIIEMREFAETERCAVTDPLTGLWNRRAFRQGLDREILRSERYGLVLSVLLLDLDDFKAINDLCGHLFGDVVLERAGKLLRRSVREADLAARYGGEEFAVLLPETDRMGAYAVGERIRRRLFVAFAEEPTAGREVRLTISGGVAAYPEDGVDAEGLLEKADRALYLAKGAGKNRVALYWAERRSEVRYPMAAGARARLIRQEEGEGRPAEAINLSRAGILLALREPPQPAEPVRVVLERRGGRPQQGFEMSGRVVRIERPSSPAEPYRVGIAFDGRVPEERFFEEIGGSRRALLAAEGAGR